MSAPAEHPPAGDARHRGRRAVVVCLAVVLAAGLVSAGYGFMNLGSDWRTASRAGTGQAPRPDTTPEAVVQVYAARAFHWRGIFAVHTWIATKPAGAERYSVHQVVGWNALRGLPVVVSAADVPDRRWYDAWPRIIADVRGPRAAAIIPEIIAAVHSYPYPDEYTLWPGPNSNTFTAWIGRHVPQLRLDLPPTAIGKDYLGRGARVAPAPSGTGYQLSWFGAVGVLAARREGLEFNLFGLVFGVDPLGPAIKLPGIGRIGFGGGRG